MMSWGGINIATEKEAKENRLIKGRQILFIVHQHFKINEEVGQVYDISNLMSVKFAGNGKLESFLNSWDMVLAGMKDEPPEKTLEILFLQELRKCSALKEDICHFDRQELGSPDKTYE